MDDRLKAAFVKAAQKQYDDEGTLEVDDNAPVSAPDDPAEVMGAYVQAWVWVSNPDCDKCKEAIEELPVLPPGEKDLDKCLCAKCAKKHIPAKTPKPKPKTRKQVGTPITVPQAHPYVAEAYQKALKQCPDLRTSAHLGAIVTDVLHHRLCRTSTEPVTARIMDMIREDVEKERNILEDVVRHFNSECRRLSREENKD